MEGGAAVGTGQGSERRREAEPGDRKSCAPGSCSRACSAGPASGGSPLGGSAPPVSAPPGCPSHPAAVAEAAPRGGRCCFPTNFWTERRPARPSCFCTGSSAPKPTSTPSLRPWPSRLAGGPHGTPWPYVDPFIPSCLHPSSPSFVLIDLQARLAVQCLSANTSLVLTVDARNHGDSPHSPDMSYEAMSQDVQDLLTQLGLVPCVLVGHSMGGRTAMLLALQRPELVERLIAVDISPVETTSNSDFPSYMAAMRAVDVPDDMSRSSARKLADQQLSTVIQDTAVRQFLLTNLVEVDGRFVWRVNLEALAQHVDKILAFPPRQESYPGPTLFLLGGNSQYVHPSHHSEIRRLFPQAQMQTVPNAGHWIHADCPQDFMAAIRGFLA
uniref:sn-1-specific diacylglycerol lipase ABHD11 n=1 Tax=Felis catus TaxID=9685 RepID=A0ABI8A0M6_FELCA